MCGYDGDPFVDALAQGAAAGVAGSLDVLKADPLVLVVLVDGLAEELVVVEHADLGDIARVVADHHRLSDVAGQRRGDVAQPLEAMGRRMDILAWNPLAAALITDFAAIPEDHRNYVRIVFTDPSVRTLYPHWAQNARLCVAQLHMEVARDPRDPRLAQLVGELSVLDTDFRRWWSDHQVAVRSRGVKDFHHPIVGDLTLDWDSLSSTDDPEQQLISWSAEPGSLSAERLQLLASWAATQSTPIEP